MIVSNRNMNVADSNCEVSFGNVGTQFYLTDNNIYRWVG